MSNEMFPPTEEELQEMIENLKIQILDAEDEEFDELDYRLSELKEQQRELIIKNNAL